MCDHRSLQILLVEDDPDHAALVLRGLRRGGGDTDFTHVDDGEKAIAYLRKADDYGDRPTPDLVLLDLHLPKRDGHEVLAAIKSDPALCTIPVLVLTTSEAESDRVRAYRHHANSYLVKPLDFDRLGEMLDAVGRYWGRWNLPASDRGPS